MYIGRLNDRLDSLFFEVTKKDLRKAHECREKGNPFAGERIDIGWEQVLSTGADLHVRISEGYLLNSIVLRLGQKCAPVSVAAYTKGKERLLSRYSGETGKAITEKEIVLSVEEYVSEFVIEVAVDFSDLIIEEIDLYGACLEGERIFPTPAGYEQTAEGQADIRAFRTASGDCAAACAAAEILAEKLAEELKIEVQIAEKGDIRFATDDSVPENGYELAVTEGGITVAASDWKGFVQGAETIVKLAAGGSAPLCKVKDKPFQGFRGVHLFLPAESEMGFAKRLIKYLISPMGYNYIILEIAGAMQFDSHPEINAAFEEAVAKGKTGEWPPLPHGSVGGGKTVSKDAVRDFVAYARRFGIEVIPEIQSLGHVQFMTLAHPDIAERPEDAPVFEATDARLADVPPSDFYAHSFCPSNPKSYEILFDLIDEIVDTVEPRQYVHMGHDEVYQIGICPVCKHRDPADLYAEDVNRLHDYLAKKGLRMMIWSDMLQSASTYKTVPAIDRIPKDVVMMDFIWYFHPGKDIEDNLLPHGFDLVYGNMYSSHFPRYESRIRKKGVTGAQISAWVGTDEAALAREGKLYDFIFTAQMFWSADYTHYARYAYDRVISAMIPRMREQLEDRNYPSLAAHAEEKVLEDKGAFDPGRAAVGGAIEVNGCFDSLVFEHTATKTYRRFPWVKLEVIGTYAVTYQDGETIDIPVTYTGNISCWNRRHNEPFAGMYYRHNGYIGASWYTDGIETRTPEGELATLYRYEWINPRPGVEISRVIYQGAAGAETEVIVQRLLGVKA